MKLLLTIYTIALVLALFAIVLVPLYDALRSRKHRREHTPK